LRSIFSEEIEEVQVVGVPYWKLQEVAAAVVKLKPGKSLTARAISEKCKTRLEWPKIPKYVKFVSDFGAYLTVTGKIQKRKLQEALIKELGLENLTKIKTA
jgi:fatty-acyl-CoA synthase